MLLGVCSHVARTYWFLGALRPAIRKAFVVRLALLLLLVPARPAHAGGWLAGCARPPGGSAVVELVVPLIGLAITIPLSEPIAHPSSVGIVAKFMLGFAEFVVNASPSQANVICW